jgi:D-glycero-D-manno-heptose 1,7-bisphosphate phosphatase
LTPTASNPSKALFLDRDGTILKEIPGPELDDHENLGYLLRTDQVELIKDSAKAISRARELRYKIIVITNQSAIARGWLTEKTLSEIHKRMYRLLLNADPSAIIDDLFYCPYYVEGTIQKYKKEHKCRKPGTGMVMEAKAKYNIDLSKSYIIGDSYTDIKCGINAGTKTILVKTGYGTIAYKKCLDEKLKIDFIADNLFEAVKFIEKNERECKRIDLYNVR